jgi:hypothetical protein
MNAHIKPNELALQRSLADVVAEYDTKAAALDDAASTFEAAGNALKMAATIGGTYGDMTIDTGHIYARDLKPACSSRHGSTSMTASTSTRFRLRPTRASGNKRWRSRRRSPWTTSAERSVNSSLTRAATSCAAWPKCLRSRRRLQEPRQSQDRRQGPAETRDPLQRQQLWLMGPRQAAEHHQRAGRLPGQATDHLPRDRGANQRRDRAALRRRTAAGRYTRTTP